MNYRKLGKTNFNISEIALGTWQVGGKWGSPFNDKTADELINTAIDNGVNFIDTADVGDFISVTGLPMLSERGEQSVMTSDWVMASKSLLPLPEKFHGLQDWRDAIGRRQETAFPKKRTDI